MTSNTPDSATPAGMKSTGILAGIWADTKGLLCAPRDLWIIYLVKLIESVAYFATIGILILYLHDDLWFSDVESGTIYGVWGTIVSVLTFIAGFVADAMGQRKALLIAGVTLVISRFLLLSSELSWVPLVGIVISAWGIASMKPVMTAAVKRHAPSAQRAFAYNIFYVVMNLGAFMAGQIVSALRLAFLGKAVRLDDDSEVAGDAARILYEGLTQKVASSDLDKIIELLPKRYIELAAETKVGTLDGLLSNDPARQQTLDYVVRSLGARATGGRSPENWTLVDLDLVRNFVDAQLSGAVLPHVPFALSGYELIFAVAALLTVCSCLLLYLLRPDEIFSAPTTNDAAPHFDTTTASEVEEPHFLSRLRNVVLSLFREPTFWAYLLFISVLVLVRAIFVHAHSTWPTYMLREFGMNVPQAAIWSVNPLLIIVFTPIIGGVTNRFSAWSVIMVGSVITAFSVLCMVFPQPFEAMSSFLIGDAFASSWEHSWAGPLAFVVTLSIGEALWSPRLYEYVAFMAPEGREASYMGLTQLPMFAAKPLVGLMSGMLLSSYCPEVGERASDTLWLVIFATTIAGPIIALSFSGVIREAERAKARQNESGHV